MNNEKALLASMLSANKISSEDYKLLSSAIDKQSAPDSWISLLINPFQKIAGWKALILGLIILVIMSMLGVIAKVYFEAPLACTFASSFKGVKISPNFFFLLYGSTLSWLLLTLFFISAAVFFKQKRIRIIDFFGTVAFSRLPTLVLVLIQVIIMSMNPKIFEFDPAKNYEFHFSFILFFSNLIWSFCYMWQIATYYHALKESSGLTGNKLWASFLLSIMFCEMIGLCLTRIFL